MSRLRGRERIAELALRYDQKRAELDVYHELKKAVLSQQSSSQLDDSVHANIQVEVVQPRRKASAGSPGCCCRCGGCGCHFYYYWGLLVWALTSVWSGLVRAFRCCATFSIYISPRKCFGHRSRVLCCCCRGDQPGSGVTDNDRVAVLIWLTGVPIFAWMCHDLLTGSVETPKYEHYITGPLSRVLGTAAAESASVYAGVPILTSCLLYSLGGFCQGMFQTVLTHVCPIDLGSSISKAIGLITGVGFPVSDVYRGKARSLIEAIPAVLYAASLALGMHVGTFWNFMCCCQFVGHVEKSREASTREPVGVDSYEYVNAETRETGETEGHSEHLKPVSTAGHIAGALTHAASASAYAATAAAVTALDRMLGSVPTTPVRASAVRPALRKSETDPAPRRRSTRIAEQPIARAIDFGREESDA